MKTLDDIKVEQQHLYLNDVNQLLAKIEEILKSKYLNNEDYKYQLNNFITISNAYKIDINNLKPNTPSFNQEDKNLLHKIGELWSECYKFKQSISSS